MKSSVQHRKHTRG